MVQMTNKRYDESLKQKYDPQGKRLAAEIMRDYIGATLEVENVKEDSGDFSDGFWDQKYRLSNDKVLRVEPEMKDGKWWGTKWSSLRPFRYAEMDIPYRKVKNKSHIHIVISTDENFAFLVTRKAMDNHLIQSGGKPKRKKTIYEPKGGLYFSTPVSMGVFLTKNSDGYWIRWHSPTKES